MKNHTSLINYIAAKIGAKSYLEIGTNNCKNFNAIQVPHKVGVDPDLTSPCSVHKTSDDFFKYNKEYFNLIFIDGLHHSDQVKRDILNAWKFLDPKGVIVIHDCNPSEEKHTIVPRGTKVWNGDVYKTVADLFIFSYGGTYEETMFTIDMDHGCCVLRKNRNELRWNNMDWDWQTFDKDRDAYLLLTSIEEGLKKIDAWM